MPNIHAKKQNFIRRAKPICTINELTTGIVHLSDVAIIWDCKLRATKKADAKPASEMTIHLKISVGIIKRNCQIKLLVLALSHD